MIGAKRSAHGGNADAGGLAVIPDKGDDFFAEVGIEDGLDVAAMKGMCALVVETVAVDGVEGEEFESARVDEIGECNDHPLAFEFPLVASAGRETEQRRAPVAVDDYTHLNAEPGRMPMMVFTLHSLRLLVMRGGESMPAWPGVAQTIWGRGIEAEICTLGDGESIYTLTAFFRHGHG